MSFVGMLKAPTARNIKARGKRVAKRGASPLVIAGPRGLKGRNMQVFRPFRAGQGRRASRLPLAFIFRAFGATGASFMWIRKALRDFRKGVDSPMPTQAVSNEEFIPRRQSETRAQKLGIDRRSFMASTQPHRKSFRRANTSSSICKHTSRTVFRLGVFAITSL